MQTPGSPSALPVVPGCSRELGCRVGHVLGSREWAELVRQELSDSGKSPRLLFKPTPTAATP